MQTAKALGEGEAPSPRVVLKKSIKTVAVLQAKGRISLFVPRLKALLLKRGHQARTCSINKTLGSCGSEREAATALPCSCGGKGQEHLPPGAACGPSTFLAWFSMGAGPPRQSRRSRRVPQTTAELLDEIPRLRAGCRGARPEHPSAAHQRPSPPAFLALRVLGTGVLTAAASHARTVRGSA